MKIFTNKSIWKKIIIALLIVLLFQAVVIKPVHADVVEFGGKLMSPILSLLVSLADGFNDVIGRTIMGATSTLYEVEMANGFWEGLKTFLVAAAAFALAIVAIVATAGLASVALAAVGITTTVTVGMGTIIAAAGVGTLAGVWFNDEVLPDDLYLPMYCYSAEEIFKGNILLFDVNFFRDAPEIKEKKNDKGEIQYYYYTDANGDEVKTSNQNSAVILKNTISSWYKALRNICLVLMLSVLVYIGIRMLLTSIASDRAKYLAMLKDWFIGLCLLFLIHYIMAFSVTLVERLTNVVKSLVDKNAYVVVLEANKKMKKAVDEKHLNQPDTIQESKDGKEYLNWPTNLMGSLRLQLQMEQYGAQYIGLCICFIMLCLFTLYFTIIYLKRVLHMAFLTLIAPMVALTYCIDKLNDGQAQGFNKWFKEYIFNLLIQPMHLLLYYILVTSAFELASKNVIYSIVALGFMIPAEKLLRSFFGFEKAQTPPALGPAGAMMATSALNHLLHKGGKGKGGSASSGLDSSSSASDKVPMPRESNPIDAFSDNEEPTAQQKMLDTYDDQYGTDDWDPQERDAMAREAYKDDNSMNYQYSDEEYANILRDSGNDEDETRKLTAENNVEEQQVRQTGVETQQPKSGAKRRIKRMAHASWAAQKAAMRSVPKKFVRKIENSHPLRTAGKLAAGVALGTAAGAAGVAIAASTGDLDNMWKVGGGTLAGGFALGSGIANGMKSPMQDELVKDIHNEAYNKGEYKQDAMNDYVRSYLKDPKNKNYFEQAFEKAEAKEMLKEGGEIEQYLKSGITDKKEMKAMHKLQKQKVVRNTDEAIAVSQLASMIENDTNSMTTKKRDEWKERIGEMAGNSGVKNTTKFAEQRLKEIDKLNKLKK